MGENHCNRSSEGVFSAAGAAAEARGDAQLGKIGLGCANPVIRPTWLGNLFKCPRSQGAACRLLFSAMCDCSGPRCSSLWKRGAGRLGPCPSKSGESRTEEELAAQFRRRALFGEQLQDDLGLERRSEGPSRPSSHQLPLQGPVLLIMRDLTEGRSAYVSWSLP